MPRFGLDNLDESFQYRREHGFRLEILSMYSRMAIENSLKISIFIYDTNPLPNPTKFHIQLWTEGTYQLFSFEMNLLQLMIFHTI